MITCWRKWRAGLLDYWDSKKWKWDGNGVACSPSISHGSPNTGTVVIKLGFVIRITAYVCVYMCGVCVIPARAVYPRHDVSTTNSPFSPNKCCVWVPESISSSIVETQIEEHQQQRVNLASSINLTLCKHLGSQFGSQFRSFVQTMTSLVAKFPSLLRPAARSPALVGLTQQVRKPTVVRIVWYSRLCMSCCNLHKLIFNLHPRHAHREVSGWLATWDRP